MKVRDIYKPLAKTVVTEIKHFVVDKVRRVGQGNFSVATKVTEASMTQTDITVGPDNPYTMKDVSNLVSIQCPYEIIAEFTSFGSIPEPEVRSEQIYFDATLETVGATQAGRFISVRVTDKDVYTAAPISVDVMNLRTGETETANLNRESQGVYTGFFQTQNNDAKGVDFDGVLYCQKDDTLRVSYEEAYAANGLSREVSLDVVVTLDFAETTIEMPTSAPFDSFLNLRVKNPAGTMLSVTNNRTGTSLEKVIGTFTPIALAYEDTESSFAVQEGDELTVVVLGKDIYGQVLNISKTLTIAAAPVVPVMDTVAIADVAKPFTVNIQDYNLPATAAMKFTNAVTGISTSVPMELAYQYSGLFSLTLPALVNLALPGQPLTLSYESNGLIVTKNIDTIMAPTEECEAAIADDSGVQSAPVTFKINGSFFLNGSFAGTIKLYADKPVRCTLIKA
jgi:hypothetical protein